MTIYNKIGATYNTTRNADPYIAGRLYEMLLPQPGGLYLDIGCGTGNYLEALTEKGLHMYGVEPSEVMLKQAREKTPDATLIQAKAESIPLPNAVFDGAVAVLTIHHWTDILKGLQEINRVLKPNGRLVLFSFEYRQMTGYWLHHYFPKMIAKSEHIIPEPEVMQKLLAQAGFKPLQSEKYFVKDDLQDHFLYSNKSRPECYLSAEIRNNTSAFSLHSDPEEVKLGVSALEKDIQSGAIQGIMKQYENDMGDYMFLVTEKEQDTNANL